MSKPKSIEELRERVDDPSLIPSKKHRRLYVKRVSLGLCCYCGKNSPEPNSRACTACKAKYWKSNPQYSATWRQTRFEKGLCTYCGKHPPVAGFKLCLECRESLKERSNKHYRENKAEHSQKASAAIRKLKLEVFTAYGGPICACCGETIFFFLSLDHINNDGNKHRMELSGSPRTSGGGRKLYVWAKVNGFPPVLQVLCMNCNFGKRMNGGICPHKQLAA